MGAFAWVTLATNDSYSLGALVLAHSLKQVGTAHQLAVLVTPGVTNAMREKLASVFNVVQEVNILDSRDQANLRLLKRPELGITFTKLHCWRLTQFEKCVFLDADTLVLENSDELFEREELSAAPDVGWPDCFNSGVFVYRPSLDTYEQLIKFALEKGSFDGGDQGLLNLYFSDWAHKDISKHLPFIYNMCSTACYSYLPAFKQFGANAKIIHFIGAQKPWLQYFNTETRKVQPSGDSAHLQEILQRWWDIFCSLIHPHLSPAMAGLAGAFSQLTLGVARTPEQDAFENILRKQAWEVGNIDYLGRDSFENIWSKITETLSFAPPQAEESAPADEEAPAAPAESQSQTAPQEEAISVQPPVLPIDTPTDNILDSSEIIEASSESIIASSEEAATKTEAAVTEDIKEIEPSVPVEEVVSSPVSDPDPPVSIEKETVAQETKVSEPEQPPTQAASEKEVVSSPVSDPDPPVSIEKEIVAQETKVSEPEQPPTQAPSEKAPAIADEATPESLQPTEPALAPEEPVAAAPSPAIVAAEPAIDSQKSESSPSVVTAPIPSSPSAATPSAIETPKGEPSSAKPSAVAAAAPELDVAKAVASSAPPAASPKTKVTAATPPATPVTPPVEKTKQALTAAANIPDTPPPSAEGSTPTPPPRKTDKPKKVAAKSKK